MGVGWGAVGGSLLRGGVGNGVVGGGRNGEWGWGGGWS